MVAYCFERALAFVSVHPCRPVTRILCGGGGGVGCNEAKVDQTTEMYFFIV